MTRRLRFCLPPLALAAALAAGVATSAGHAAPTASGRTLTLYALVAKEQFVDNRDDRQRGLGTNPFGQSAGTGTATTNERGRGPLPGDEAMFEYALYRTADLRQRAGTGLLVCEYGFGKLGLCHASYRVGGDLLVGFGSIPALTTASFGVSITGGTGGYRGVKGTLLAVHDRSPRVPGNERVSHNVPALLLETQKLTLSLAPAAPSAAAGTRTLYSLAKQEQFIDNGDDERLGWSINPWGMRDPEVEASRTTSPDGPFPGDEALFRFAVHARAGLGDSASRAVYTCEYAFGRTGLCTGSYRFDSGTLFVEGAFGFAAKRYVLAVVGGTGTYVGATGELSSGPGPKGAQRILLTLR